MMDVVEFEMDIYTLAEFHQWEEVDAYPRFETLMLIKQIDKWSILAHLRYLRDTKCIEVDMSNASDLLAPLDGVNYEPPPTEIIVKVLPKGKTNYFNLKVPPYSAMSEIIKFSSSTKQTTTHMSIDDHSQHTTVEGDNSGNIGQSQWDLDFRPSENPNNNPTMVDTAWDMQAIIQKSLSKFIVWTVKNIWAIAIGVTIGLLVLYFGVKLHLIKI